MSPFDGGPLVSAGSYIKATEKGMCFISFQLEFLSLTQTRHYPKETSDVLVSAGKTSVDSDKAIQFSRMTE